MSARLEWLIACALSSSAIGATPWGDACAASTSRESSTTDGQETEETFEAYVKKKPDGWYLGAMLPRLSEARGKIVLVRRFGASSAEGVDATSWADKATFTIAGPPRLRVQDEYEVSDTAKKWSAITALLDEARGGAAATLYLNYASGYKPLLLGVPNIRDVSDAINPKLAAYFADGARRKGRYGVVAMDFVDARRAELLLRENF